MKIISTVFLFAVLMSAQAQKISVNLEDHRSENADLVLFAYGSDNPVKIGTIDVKGNLVADLSKVQLSVLTEDIKEMFTTELRNVFSFNCAGSDDFGKQGSVNSVRGGNIAIWANNEWAGSFFLVSDPELKPWLEDPGYNSAIKGFFWEIVYVDADVSLNFNCSEGVYYMEDSSVEVLYTFNLNLKKGFNWVEYSIEDVFITDPDVRASFPSKVRVSNLQDPGRMKWMANYSF